MNRYTFLKICTLKFLPLLSYKKQQKGYKKCHITNNKIAYPQKLQVTEFITSFLVILTGAS